MQQSTAPMMTPAVAAAAPPTPPSQCPRCDSRNTKFCYYNNYNLSQPRHFCRDCRRFWTKGGTLRDVPVGGGTRKPSSHNLSPPKPRKRRRRSGPVTADPLSATTDPTDERLLDFTESFSSLLGCNGGFESMMGVNDVFSSDEKYSMSALPESLHGDFSCWISGWPDLSM